MDAYSEEVSLLGQQQTENEDVIEPAAENEDIIEPAAEQGPYQRVVVVRESEEREEEAAAAAAGEVEEQRNEANEEPVGQGSNGSDDDDDDKLPLNPRRGYRVSLKDVMINFFGGRAAYQPLSSDPQGTELEDKGRKTIPEWPRRSSKFMFRVPVNLRHAYPEAFQPRLFHFGPYASRFFPPITSTSPDPPAAAADPFPSSQDHSYETLQKSIMVEDLMGHKTFDTLVAKISADQVLAEIRDLYPEKIPLMDLAAIPSLNLARLFASSAAIIMSSIIIYTSSSGNMALNAQIFLHTPQTGGRGRPESLPIRHAIVNQYNAITDAVTVMDNQIPILLLKLACEAHCESDDRLYDVRFDANTCNELMSLNPSAEYVNVSPMRLLVYIMRKCLKVVSPFQAAVAESIWAEKELRRTCSWIDQNHGKPLIAYVYDALVGRLDEDAAKSHSAIDMPTTTDAAPDKQYDCSRGRMMSASELQRWGVTFRSGNDGSCFRGIRLDDKLTYTELTLPMITLNDTTMRLLCNLMAYELTTKHEAVGRLQHICSYVLFLNYLIDREEDVEVLMEAGVLKNEMAKSNASVAEMLDKFLVESRSSVIDLTPEHGKIVEQLRKACRRRRWWHCWTWLKAMWKERIISVGAATLLLLLTMLQTIYTMQQQSVHVPNGH